jgi:hypothetical protein
MLTRSARGPQMVVGLVLLGIYEGYKARCATAPLGAGVPKPRAFARRAQGCSLVAVPARRCTHLGAAKRRAPESDAVGPFTQRHYVLNAAKGLSTQSSTSSSSSSDYGSPSLMSLLGCVMRVARGHTAAQQLLRRPGPVGAASSRAAARAPGCDACVLCQCLLAHGAPVLRVGHQQYLRALRHRGVRAPPRACLESADRVCAFAACSHACASWSSASSCTTW